MYKPHFLVYNGLVNDTSLISHQTALAKLLAKENVNVQVGNFTTAFFDVESRTLGLPRWNTDSKAVSDLLVGHEVGHALYTPADGIAKYTKRFHGKPFAVLNIVEDIRIEKLVQRSYPGITRSFTAGYADFIARDFFKIRGVDLKQLGFIDRLNLQGKIGSQISVPLTPQERKIYRAALAAETFDDVLNVCEDIFKLVGDIKEKGQNSSKEDCDCEDKSPQPSDTDEQQPAESNIADSEDGQSDDDTKESDKSSSDDQNDDADAAHDRDGDGDGDGDSDGDGNSQSLDEQFDGSASAEDNTADAESSSTADQPSKESDSQPNNDGEFNPTYSEKDIIGSTNSSLEENLANLQEADNYVTINTPHPREIANTIIPLSDILNARRNTDRAHYEQLQSSHLSDWLIFKKNIEKHVAVLVKDFERRKAAWQYSRATVSRKGSIDVNNLHKYKYDDAIFRSITSLADAKSHGMIFCIDYSGSMRQLLGGVIEQLIPLVMFCRKVGIPYKVYGFYSEGNYTHVEKTQPRPGVNIRFDETRIIELLNSKQKKSDSDLSLHEMFTIAQVCRMSYSYQVAFVSDYERWGYTPLSELMIVGHKLISDFRREHTIQKMNFMVLSDGDPCHVNHSRGDLPAGVETKPHAERFPNGYRIEIAGKEFFFSYNSGYDFYASLTAHLGQKTGANMIGYFLSDGKKSHVRALTKANMRNKNREMSAVEASIETDTQRRESKKTGFSIISGGGGYDTLYVFRPNSNLSAGVGKDEEFKVDEDIDITKTASVNKLAKSFLAHQNSNKDAYVFLRSFAEKIA